MGLRPTGSFVPTNLIWDVQQLHEVDVNSDEFKELLIRLYQNVNNISMQLNVKDTGVYDVNDSINGQVFFSNPDLNSSTTQKPTLRQVIRKVINFGALPNTGTTSVAHGITVNTGTSFTRIYGTSSKQTATFSYVSIPYASNVANNNIELYVDNTNVNVTTAANWSAWTTTYIVLEFLVD